MHTGLPGPEFAWSTCPRLLWYRGNRGRPWPIQSDALGLKPFATRLKLRDARQRTHRDLGWGLKVPTWPVPMVYREPLRAGSRSVPIAHLTA